ncbi:oxygen-independent coproporphyrinogen III oxidase [Ornithobacterium rhinotracheale]|uniref:oxygen-independent coproporphyrinogen III oxidase n=1 Tax=Ornithobacterium rhinotracheale TaxID=28251 RepID=UPI00129C38B4|nr:oxygen-independent coproporphyrinogen III oxidase [Ornithobacterium rhinotracheale]MRJ08470.1 oxygen-independent coproporphyrinogen III oxidase [Ornithobacterium rhinotracheale]UOH76747.1 oxygen-independent coproporphyrinogen III oxidase [Ornithobacterium rhinotracheale]
MNKELIQKYNIPGPRYTSYPTVPYWDNEHFSVSGWEETLKKSFKESNQKEGISLYLHLPFCESLCTFCACHKHITKRHQEVEMPYIQTVLKEWDLYLNLLDEKPIIKELHLGGGTPTFFSPENLKFLLESIFSKAEIAENPEFSIEGHPNNTTYEHMKMLYDLGFRRISFGVQDYDLKVQEAIHRIQPFENVKRVTDQAREIGYESISHDLVFGLPFHTLDKMKYTIAKTKELNPDRIAFYSYAHVPWIKGVGQRGFDEKDLPSPAEKRELYEVGKEIFEQMGYEEIGMDHFSLKTDKLYLASKNGTLHRNFMGYSSSKTQVMIGLGMSSISDSWYSFAQNNKSLKEYTELVENGIIPVTKGHILSQEDLTMRRHILNLMCNLKTNFKELPIENLDDIKTRLAEMERDELIEFTDDELIVTEAGRIFIRNICMAFDLRMLRNKPETRIFSMTI